MGDAVGGERVIGSCGVLWLYLHGHGRLRGC
jgi:hypothetical protein